MKELEHILEKINNSKVDFEPFNHIFIENIFSDEFYTSLKKICDNPEFVLTRGQDNKSFTNNRYPIYNNSKYDELKTFINIFESKEVKNALLSKFYKEPSNFINNINIHQNECEFVYTPINKFQNIHTDIPSKFLSMVFYFPNDVHISEKEQFENGTILYDKELNPVQKAKFIPNSVCIFAPHLYTYHGFNTTIERTALVMFYIHDELHKQHERSLQQKRTNESKISSFKSQMLTKVQSFPMIEYENKNILEFFSECKINAPLGRIYL